MIESQSNYTVKNSHRTPSQSTSDWARWYVEQGIPVFPLHGMVERDGQLQCTCGTDCGRDAGKHPYTPFAPQGEKSATTNLALVNKWFVQRPNLNLAYRIEPLSLVIVAPDSLEWHQKFLNLGLPPTLTIQSGGGEGHLHYLYRLPRGWPATRNCQSGQYDIIASGYAVGPGSRHQSGRYYEVVNRVSIADLPEAPTWVRDFLVKEEKQGVQPLDHDEPPVPLDPSELRWWNGERKEMKDQTIDRSATLIRIGRILVKHGLSRRGVHDALRDRDLRLWSKPKYADRTDAEKRYLEIVDQLLADVQSTRRGIAAPTTKGLMALMKTIFPEPTWCVKDILPEGVALLVGRPKVGKSWWLLQLALAIVRGSEFMTGPVPRGDVLYLALEDNERRLQRRVFEMLGGEALTDDLAQFDYQHTWPRFDDGGIAAIENWLADHPSARLVVVDTLAKARPNRKRNGDLYEEDYAALTTLQELAGRYNVAVVVAHHTRKADADDVIDTVSGTTGLTGAADTLLILRRARFGHDATLAVIGRDITDEKDYALALEDDPVRWVLVGQAEEVQRTRAEDQVIRAFGVIGSPWTTAQEVANAAGKSLGSTRNILYRLITDGLVERDQNSSNHFRLVSCEKQNGHSAAGTGTEILTMTPLHSIENNKN